MIYVSPMFIQFSDYLNLHKMHLFMFSPFNMHRMIAFCISPSEDVKSIFSKF